MAKKEIIEKKSLTQRIPLPESIKKVLRPLANYLKGSWEELGMVHWPNRRTSVELTLAVLGFSGFFVIFILLLDALFKYLFNLVF